MNPKNGRFSRSEFIIKSDIPYFLEMNTIPGLTESILPQQAACAGISLSGLHKCYWTTMAKNA